MRGVARESAKLMGTTLVLQVAASLFVGLIGWGSDLQETLLSPDVAHFGLVVFFHHLIWVAPLVLGLSLIGVYSTVLSDRILRRILILYLSLSIILLVLPWLLVLITSAGFPVVEEESGGARWLISSVAILGLAFSFALGWRRDRFTGPRALVGVIAGGVFWLIAMVLVGVLGVHQSGDLGSWVLFTIGAWLWAGLLVQYPSIFWFAWKTPAEQWGDGPQEDEAEAVFEPAVG